MLKVGHRHALAQIAVHISNFVTRHGRLLRGSFAKGGGKHKKHEDDERESGDEENGDHANGKTVK